MESGEYMNSENCSMLVHFLNYAAKFPNYYGFSIVVQ